MQSLAHKHSHTRQQAGPAAPARPPRASARAAHAPAPRPAARRRGPCPASRALPRRAPAPAPPAAPGPAGAPTTTSAVPAPATAAGGSRRYPFIDLEHPGLELVHAEPPVYVIHGFLSDEDCDALVAAAEGGALDGLDYEDAVLLDTHKLWPLLLVVAAGAAFDTLHGAGAAAALTDPTLLLPAAGAAAARWAAAVGGLLLASRAAMRSAIGGRVFTGTKWTVASLFRSDRSSSHAPGAGGAGAERASGGRDPPQQEAAAAAATAAAFIGQTTSLLRTPAAHLEPPTVTRYTTGQQQRVHFDGRPAGDPSGLQAFLAAGGQRLVQVVCYLRTLEPGAGGGTRFHHPSLGGLDVRPRKGMALVFFPAFDDGTLDGRMAHSGQPVASPGAEKWIVNTWACQRPVPSAVDPAAAAAAAAARERAVAGAMARAR